VTLLKEAARHRLRKLVLVSSGGTVYGVARGLPISEEHATRPISPYGITKLAIENYGWMHHALLDVPVVVVRPGNAYGEGQRMLSGQGFIATAMQRIKAGEAVEIFGATGTIRDYIHVSDVASGIVAALDAGKPGTAYNIGTGAGLNNVDVLRLVEPHAARAGLPVRTRLLPERKFDVPANVLDSSRLRAISDWRPAVEIGAGIAGLWAAVLRNLA
jgi:UDP-glucose 4-epimerase